MSEDTDLLDYLDRTAGRTLVSFARETIERVATAGSEETPVPTPDTDHDAFDANFGAFVTIERGERLRGCCGRPAPAASTPLWRVLSAAAIDASRNDPRCPPIEPAELDEITVTVTVLTAPTSIDVSSPAAYPGEIEVGRDGLIVRAGRQEGLLLPQVALDRDWSASAFLTAACQKAGLPGTAWRNDDVGVEHFTARKFEERRPRGAVEEHRFNEQPVDDSTNADESTPTEPHESGTRSTHEHALDGGRPTGIGVRSPAVAGQFYARAESALREQLQESFDHEYGPGPLDGVAGLEQRIDTALEEMPTAIVSPHAGYPFSGPVAAHGFAAIAGSGVETAIVLGPNHQGPGASAAVAPHDAWRTPLGEVSIDGDLAAAVVEDFERATFDVGTHDGEHSIEVQLPFLQYCCGAVSVVPICLSRLGPDEAESLGRALAGTVDRIGRDAVFVSSTDLTHYEPHDRAVAADEPVVEAMEALDTDSVARARTEERHSMCGPWATVAGLTAARELGATEGELLQYATSGQTEGERNQVVGYCSVAAW